MNQWEIVLQLALRFIVIALWVGSVALLLSSSPVQSIVIEPLAAAIGLVFSSVWTIGKGRAQDGFESSLSRAKQLDSRLRQTTDLFLFAILAALLGLMERRVVFAFLGVGAYSACAAALGSFWRALFMV